MITTPVYMIAFFAIENISDSDLPVETFKPQIIRTAQSLLHAY